MSYIFRKIRKSKWYNTEAVPWLGEGQLQADALADLCTEGNELSLWVIEDDQSNLDLVITAIAATFKFVSNCDYALLDQSVFNGLDIRYKETAGNSPHEVANTFHVDAVELTADKLYQLAQAIHNSGSRHRYSSKKILQLLVGNIKAGQIRFSNLNDDLKESLNQKGFSLSTQ